MWWDVKIVANVQKSQTTCIAGGLWKPLKGAVKQSQNLMVVAHRHISLIHNIRTNSDICAYYR
jgi:hypothetical protein